MLWPVLNENATLKAATAKFQHVPDSPYMFSIARTQEVQGRTKIADFDFQIEMASGNAVMQLTFIGGAIASFDSLVAKESYFSRFNSPYSISNVEEQMSGPLELVPIAKGKQPEITGTTIIQKSEMSLLTYSNAVVISFDEFADHRIFCLDRDFRIAVSDQGALSTLILGGTFRDAICAAAAVI